MPDSAVYDFNRGWLFGEYAAKAEAPGFDDSHLVEVTLPHTVTALSWADWNPSTWQKKWIYRKRFDSSKLAPGRVFVDFDGVLTSARLFLDGRQVGLFQGGYLPFSVELSSAPAGTHVFAVKVDSEWQNVPPEGAANGAASIDFLEPGGIYRDVTLRVVPEIFIADVFAMPQAVTGASPTLRVQVTVDAAHALPQPAHVQVELVDGAATVASGSTSLAITKAGKPQTNLTLTGFGKPELWSPSSPKLYTVRTTLTDQSGAELHTLDVRTGFRQVSFGVNGFQLNGQPFKIFGLNRHQLYPYLGMAANERLQRRDAELLKNTLNCNMVRCSHYPQSPHFLDACDELGLMVWEEIPGWQYVGADKAFQNLVVQNVHDMVMRDRNRPSVIVWATRVNESDNKPKVLYQLTRQTAGQLDGSRQTSGAMRIYSKTAWAQDVFAYDDYSLHAKPNGPPLQPPLPGVPYFVSEAVGALDGKPLYRWIDDNATLATQADLHARKHNAARSSPAYAGLLGWAGIDYASLQGGNRNWHNMKWAGVLDAFRVPKPGAAFYRSQCSPANNPVILPVFYWDFGAKTPNGPGNNAMIATNCDYLQVTMGSGAPVKAVPAHQTYSHLDHPPVFVDLRRPPGAHLPELKIDGYVGNTEVQSIKMSGDTSGDHLELTIEDDTLEADGHDATRFTFRAVDKYGNQRPYVTGDVTLSLSGPGILTPNNNFPFQLYGGVGGGYIRAYPRRQGTVTLTVRHSTLGTATGSLQVVPTQAQWI
jgi:beta-galactosidase